MPLTDREKGFFALARKHIGDGRLPRSVPASVWAGPGTGATCSLCELSIEAEHVEYELSGNGGAIFRFHMRCHAIWQLAADDRIAGG